MQLRSVDCVLSEPDRDFLAGRLFRNDRDVAVGDVGNG